MNVTDGASEETIVVAPYWPGEGYGGGTKVASMEEAIAEAKHLAKQGYGKGKSIIHIVRTTRTVIEWNSDHSDLAALPRPEADEGAVAEIAAERRRQVEVEGWSVEHDDGHANGELAQAAACYAQNAADVSNCTIEHENCEPAFWPWEASWWKPSTPRRDLIKAAALIVAEIERLDRAALAAAQEGSK